MHIITYTYRSGTTRHVTFESSVYAFSFIRGLRKKGIEYTHHFEE